MCVCACVRACAQACVRACECVRYERMMKHIRKHYGLSPNMGRGNIKSTNLRLVLVDSLQHTEITPKTPDYWLMFVEMLCMVRVQCDDVIFLVSTMLHVDHVVSRCPGDPACCPGCHVCLFNN